MTFHPLGSTFVRADVTRSIRTGPIVLLAVFVRLYTCVASTKVPAETERRRRW